MVDSATLSGIATSSIANRSGVAAASIASISGINFTADSFYNGVIDYSCMRDSATATQLSRTSSQNETNTTKHTISLWMKRTRITVGANITLICHYGDSNNYSNLYISTADQIGWATKSGGTTRALVTTDSKLRDCSGWYHIYLGYDSTRGADDDAMEIYINGIRQDLTFTTGISLNEDGIFNYDAYTQYVGNYGASLYFDGYMAAVNVETDQYVAYTNFGEFSGNIWIPKAYTHSGTQNGYQLMFATDSNLGDDTSGSADGDFTVTNMGTDHQVTDTPENNYCTYDDNIHYSTVPLKDGGLMFPYSGASWHHAGGTFLMKSGKWYWEIDMNGDAAYIIAGIYAGGEYSADTTTSSPYNLYQQPQAWMTQAFIGDELRDWNNNSSTDSTNLSGDANSIVMIAFDADNNKLWFGADNTWSDVGGGVGDPANGTNPDYDSADGIDSDLYDYAPTIGSYQQSTSITNFGQRSFVHTPPTGFNALCTSNLPDPVLDDCGDAVDIVTYTGTGAELEISDLAFQPDFVWIKNRDAADPNHVFDSTQTATYWLETDGQAGQQNNAQTLKSFDADGFTLGTDDEVNTNTENYVAWCLKESADYGIDILTYEGTGVARTQAHNLGAIPKMIWVKNIDNSDDNWGIYHYAALNKTDPETDYGSINNTSAWADLTCWNDTAPTSSVFSLGTNNFTNENNQTFMAYLFADIEGLTKVFHYEGNGNAAGPYVYCGFRPRWIILKNADGVADWIIIDTERDPYNQMDNYLEPSDSNIEDTTGENEMDFYANGFKIRNTDAACNTNNATYVGVAFAEQPFKYANAR